MMQNILPVISDEELTLQIFKTNKPYNENPIKEKVIKSPTIMRFGIGIKGLPLFLICKEYFLLGYSTRTFQNIYTIESSDFSQVNDNTNLQFNNEAVIMASNYILIVVNVVKGVIEKRATYSGLGFAMPSLTKLNDEFILCGGRFGRCCLLNVNTMQDEVRQCEIDSEDTNCLCTRHDDSIAVPSTKSQIITHDVKIFQLKDRYVSEVRDNNNEVGVCYYNNGDKYIGEYTVNIFEYKDLDLSIFTKGKYPYIIRNGFGIMKYKNGDTMIEEWKNDKLNGYGKIIKNNGKYYLGEFKDGE